ncbi:MAG TPA: MerR family transcriptional regulator [Spirochaetia bacterium]|nr:MerR family transcriptional regulator [Spirochaetia bacterium]
MSYTISRLASLFRLSRSTLLYYDSLGLLCASERSGAGYRLYSESDKERLGQIVLFRGLGVPLLKIRDLLGRSTDPRTPILMQRLLAINSQIDQLRSQQHAILDMVEAEGLLKGAATELSRHSPLGAAMGVTETNYRAVHRVFERVAPREHRRFLRFLGFTETQVRALLQKKS